MFTIPQIAINILTSSGINWYLKSIQNAIESEKIVTKYITVFILNPIK